MSRMRKLFKKSVAGALALTLLLEAGITEAFAMPETGLQEPEKETELEFAWSEQTEKRGKNSRVFLTEDGTEVVALYEYPVYYQTDGQWAPYDYGLELVSNETENEYRVKDGSMQTAVSRYYYDGKFLTVGYGDTGSSMKWELPLHAGESAELCEFSIEDGFMDEETEPATSGTEEETVSTEETEENSEETITEENTLEQTEESLDNQEEVQEDTSEITVPDNDVSKYDTADKETEAGLEAEDDLLALSHVRSYGQFEKIQEGVNLGVEQWPGNIKLSVVFENSFRAKQGIDFLLDLEGINLEQEEDCLLIKSSESEAGAGIFAVLKAPVLYDGDRLSGGAEYRLSEREDGSTSLSVIPDEEWMEDLDRTCPITLIIHLQQEEGKPEYLHEIQGTEKNYNGYETVVGNTLETVQTVISGPNLPEAPEGKSLKAADLILCRKDIEGIQRKTLKLGAYGWKEQESFKDYPMDSVTYQAGDEEDIRFLDVTEAFKDKEDQEHGMLLKSMESELVTGVYGFDAFDDDSIRPSFLFYFSEGNSSEMEETGNGGVDYSGVSEEDSYIIGEDPEKRDRFTKHFLTESGNYMAAVYEDPVHYLENEKWEEIDNTLQLSSEGEGGNTEQRYENRASDVDIEIARYASSDSLVSIQSEDGSISWGLCEEESILSKEQQRSGENAVPRRNSRLLSEFVLQDMGRTEGGTNSADQAEMSADSTVRTGQKNELTAAVLPPGSEPLPSEPMFLETSNTRGDVSAAEYNAEQMAVPNLTSGGVYTDILPGVDIQYVLESVNLKENVILKSKTSAEQVLKFRVHHPGMKMTLEEDGSVTIKKAQEEVTPYTFMRPYMYDSQGNTSTDVTYQLTSEGEDTTVLTILPDREWLMADDREYPVTIDPVTETQKETKSIVDAFVRQKQPGEAASGWGSFAVGYVPSYGICRSLVKFNNLPVLEKGDLIYKAVFNVYQYKYDASAAANFRVTAHKPTSDWPTTVTWSTQPGCDTTVLDYQTVEPVADKFQPHLKQFDITSLVRSWYNTGINYGIELRSVDEALRAEAYFITSNNSAFVPAAYPSGTFYYKNTAGLESYWSYHEQDAGRAGYGYTNDFNGNVVFTHADAATTGNRLPVSVSHVYNLCEADQSSRFGNGWRLNIMQRLETTGMSLFPYVYTDADGTKHYFYKDSEDGNKLKDEDGLGLTITQESSSDNDEYRTITCKDKSKLVFDIWGYLRRSIDTNGNVIRYNYGPRADGNYLGNISDPTGAFIDFAYSADFKHLVSMTDRTTGRTTSYQYDTAGNLISITYPDGKKSTYTYDNKKLTQAKAPDGYAIEYLYLMDFNVPRVKMFRERGTGNTIGRSVETSYRNGNTTTFQYPGLDGDTTAKADNPVFHYDFDNLGRPLTIYDDEGSANNYTYYSDGRKNNKLKENGALRSSIFNYLSNPGFDTGDSLEGDSWYAYRSGGDFGYGVNRMTDVGYTGNTSIRVTKGNLDAGLAAVAHDVTGLSSGTYTLSAYVKAAGVSAQSGNADGAVLGVTFLTGNKANTTEICQEARTGVTNTAIDNGWQRMSTSFTVTQNGTNVRIFGGLNNAMGTVYYDSFQLEKGAVAEGYNLVNNAGFEYNYQGGYGFNVWTRHNMLTDDGNSTVNVKFNGHSARVTGDPDTRRYYRQVVNVNGGEGDVYNLSGWAKANAVPGKEFRLGAEIRYSDGSKGWRYFEFDPYLTDWQFTGGMFSTDDNNSSTNLTYTSIIIHAFYGSQCNTAWFDGIQLTKDDGETYVYDKDGNLVSAKDAVEKDSFKMDQYGNLRNMTSITGSSFSYGYDEKQNMTWARNSDGLSYQFTYDAFGNPTSSKITGEGTNQELVSGKVYRIIQKTSGKALDVHAGTDANGTAVEQFTAGSGTNQQWKLVEWGDGYWKLVSMCSASGRVLAVKGGANTEGAVTHIFTADGGVAQRFKFKRNSDGSYQIIAKCSNDTKCLTNFNASMENSVPITIRTINGTHSDQSWYLEPVESGNGIHTSQTYTANGRQVTSATDARGNTVNYGYDSKGRMMTSTTDPSGITTSYTYDNNDRLTGVSRPLNGQSISNGYTYTNDKLHGISHNGFTYSFVYDQWGNTSSVKVGNQMLSSQALLPHNGPVSEKTYGNGQKVSYAYDKQEQVTEIKYDGTAAFRYKYDNYGNDIQHDDLLNNVKYFFKYDSLGRPVIMRTTHGQELQISYDNKNRADKVVCGIDGVNTTTEYLYGNAASGQMPDMAYGVKIDGSQMLTYTYDKLCRTATRKLNLTAPYLTSYTFLQNAAGGDTTLVSSVTDGNKTLNYTYDARGNITSVSEGDTEKLRYTYDDLDQLIRADDAYEGKTYTYAYDAGGNLTSRSDYAYTAGDLGEAVSTVAYAYGDANWKDKLTGYNGQSLTYDAIGNPLTWRDGISFTWQHGREMKTFAKGGSTYSYSYDEDGYRVKKQHGNTVTDYYLNGDLILTQKTGNDRMDFLYDDNDQLLGFKDNGTKYYYTKNLQGDVTGILDGGGTLVVSYTYDPWGKQLTCTGTMANTIGEKNPFRYRGYYYDAESGLYYLNSRYYDPVVGRFVNADGYISTGQGLLGSNMFLYCLNNPVMLKDSSGEIAGIDDIFITIVGLALGIAAVNGANAIRRKQTSIAKKISNSYSNVKKSVTKLYHAAAVSVGISVAKKIKYNVKTRQETIKAVGAEILLKKKRQAYFTENPYDFKPAGLILDPHVLPGTGSNGGVLKWEIPGTHIAIFEWNEDYKNGPHYHVLKAEWDNKHNNKTHYRSGTPVPEPWNSMYFGGQ